uniref:fibronectin-like isoform X1 n=2 Tax=Styela clava TaxID=7725 RepID=UPI001939DA9D|nr:fibronectin-like isoform X1 [Styela clava]
MKNKMKIFVSIFIICLASMVYADSLPKPERIRVSQRTKTSFKINWRSPITQEYTRYTVKISPEAIISEPANLGESSRTFTELEPGERYNVFVQGFTADGQSSSVLKYEVWTIPDEPTGMELSAVQEIAISISIMGIQTKFTAFVDGMQVEWNDDSQEKMVSGYDLQIEPDEGVIVESDDEEAADKMTRIVTGLTPGKEYSVALRTRVGPDYDPVYSQWVRSKMRMPPAIPYALEAVETEPTSVLLKTHGPLEGIHDDLTFEMAPRHGTIGDATQDPNYPMFDLYQWQGLRPGTTYNLKMFAVSKNVKGYAPKTLTFSTAPAPPLRIRVTDYDHYSVTLQWAHAHKFTDFDEVQYMIEFSSTPDGKTQFASVKNFKFDSQVVVQIQKLIPGTIYNFRVFTVLNGVKGAVPAEVEQTTIPLEPTLMKLITGRDTGIKVAFGPPIEGGCPQVKVFYSPSVNGEKVTPKYYKLGETVEYSDVPTDGRYSVHARCVSLNVEGPELVVTPETAPGDVEEDDAKSERRKNDTPTNGKRPLLCASLVSTNPNPKPDSIAPNACCNLRPYNTAERECCGNALLEKEGDRLCCDDKPYNKRFFMCCAEGEARFLRSRREGCAVLTPIP